jgi:short-subunit dehydrogenase involved in D-alanine esterification of teichoic acids
LINKYNLKGKNILITGASSGLGIKSLFEKEIYFLNKNYIKKIL